MRNKIVCSLVVIGGAMSVQAEGMGTTESVYGMIQTSISKEKSTTYVPSPSPDKVWGHTCPNADDFICALTSLSWSAPKTPPASSTGGGTSTGGSTPVAPEDPNKSSASGYNYGG